MSTEGELDTPELDHGSDGSTELDQRAMLRLLFNEPAIRNYAFAAFGALAMIFLVLFEQGSALGGLLIVIMGVCGVLFRWTAAPVLVLLILTYFMWTPTGNPFESYSSMTLIEERRFHFIDVILVLSVLVYLSSQYRIYSLVYQAIAFEGVIQRKGEPPTRRPATLIRPTELVTMLALSVVLVIAGQLLWLFATSVEVVPAAEFPLQVAESRSSLARFLRQEGMRPGAGSKIDPGAIDTIRFNSDGVLSPRASRFYVLLGMLLMGTLITRLVFGYWRLRTIGPAEGGMILLDVGWRETSRERVRLEKWRVWGRKRAEAQAKQDKSTRSKP
ncbi:MAG TPA: hypothetical protein VG122_24395 [Gemmata sp.]|jgi:hypothetical protein|nr:hypothetical protein [Gemmata sp.]